MGRGFWRRSSGLCGAWAGRGPRGPWGLEVSPGPSCAVSSGTGAGFLAAWRLVRAAGTARAPVWTPLLLFSKQRPRGLGTLSAPLPLVTSRWRLHTHKGQGSRRRLIAGGLQSAGCACGTGAVTVAISRKCSLPHLDCQSSRSGPLSSVWRNVGNLK